MESKETRPSRNILVATLVKWWSWTFPGEYLHARSSLFAFIWQSWSNENWQSISSFRWTSDILADKVRSFVLLQVIVDNERIYSMNSSDSIRLQRLLVYSKRRWKWRERINSWPYSTICSSSFEFSSVENWICVSCDSADWPFEIVGWFPRDYRDENPNVISRRNTDWNEKTTFHWASHRWRNTIDRRIPRRSHWGSSSNRLDKSSALRITNRMSKDPCKSTWTDNRNHVRNEIESDLSFWTIPNHCLNEDANHLRVSLLVQMFTDRWWIDLPVLDSSSTIGRWFEHWDIHSNNCDPSREDSIWTSDPPMNWSPQCPWHYNCIVCQMVEFESIELTFSMVGKDW